MARMKMILAILMALAAGAYAREAVSTQMCAPLDLVRNTTKDATPAISDCIRKMGAEGTLRLHAGIYRLLTPLVIDRTITIETAPAAAGQVCAKDTGANCAVLMIGQIPPQPTAHVMPVEITARNVRFRSMVVMGVGHEDAAWQRRICLDQRARPLGGGVRVKADGFEMADVLLKGASCYTALEVIKGVKGGVIKGNVIGPNGNHEIQNMWADGITIHDAEKMIIENNLFRDNTDVHLIFGGCVKCRITNNRFIHSGDFARASFAVLMLHAWQDTSGNFADSVTSGNAIDCGVNRRCGYGIMIGGEPWYPSKASGGTVNGNQITNTLMAINIDKLTGPMDVGANFVSLSGGTANSDCGPRDWPAVNISPESRRFVNYKPKKYGSLDTRKCLINR